MPPYTVKEITERTELSPKGEFYLVYEVKAVAEDGTEFTVIVPESEFTEENVRKKLEEKARQILAIKRL